MRTFIEAKTLVTDLPAQLTPSTREVMAVAKQTAKLVKSSAPADQKEQDIRHQQQQQSQPDEEAFEEQMTEFGTS
ncbi:unnamed protein product [Nippostrongylus brasiliensis]|uniref:PRTRC system protein E n=1 Tax=Nippostrongylus brasiliensis TaxID=27835 RepID=A0A0N4Y732_NIPBR|nr:unnamed protein product [Nippostrongylus brasiliensis]